MLQLDVEDVAVEHHHVDGGRVANRRLNALRGTTPHLQRHVTTIDDARSQRRVACGQQYHHVEVAAQRIGEREHPLEVSESDAATAVGGQQRARAHRRTARAAAHAWIRRSAMTTSSWSDEVIAG